MKKKKELQMPEDIFFKVLKRMLESHEIHLKANKKLKKATLDLYESMADYTLSHYDDFYEFLQHWKDYEHRGQENENNNNRSK